ncbi:MAG: phage holin family protein [Pseudomonadota bacterium]
MASPFAAVRRLSTATVALLVSRAEFASLELAQTRAQLIRWIVLALAVAVLALLALFAGTALFAVLLWPRLGWIALAVPAGVYALLALWLFRRLSTEVANAPPVLSETLRELSADRAALLAAGRTTDEDDAE